MAVDRAVCRIDPRQALARTVAGGPSYESRAAIEALATYPLQAIRQVHLAGGHCHAGFWVDDHGTDIEEASYAILDALRGRAPLVTAIVERDANLPSIDVLAAQSARIAAVWRDGP